MNMMNLGLELVLVAFALVGYAGTGSSLAVARYRALDSGEVDLGMLGVAVMLWLFAAVCTTVAVGWLGVISLGVIAMWLSYVLMARQIGLFSIEVQAPTEPTLVRSGA